MLSAVSTFDLRNQLSQVSTDLRTRQFWRTLGITFLGCLLFSVSVNGLLRPQHFISSGVTGLAMIIHYAFGWPSISICYWLLNIPIFALGWRTMSLTYVVLSLIGTFFSGLALWLTDGLYFAIPWPPVAVIMAGIISGIGVGSYIRAGGAAGGLDIVAAVAYQKLRIPVGTTILGCNIIILLIGAAMHDIQTALHTALLIAVSSFTINRVHGGHKKATSDERAMSEM